MAWSRSMKVKSGLSGIENDSSLGPGPVQLPQAELQAHCLLTRQIVWEKVQTEPFLPPCFMFNLNLFLLFTKTLNNNNNKT